MDGGVGGVGRENTQNVHCTLHTVHSVLHTAKFMLHTKKVFKKY